MRGTKGSPYRGGTRVPAFWRWPGTLPAGVDIATPATRQLLRPRPGGKEKTHDYSFGKLKHFLSFLWVDGKLEAEGAPKLAPFSQTL